MGTRADFYIGRGREATWLGSCAYDGWPGDRDITPACRATTVEAFREAVLARIAKDDGTRPEQGWPWPWETSSTTDFAYAFDEGRVWYSCFGSAWRLASEYDQEADEPEDSEAPPAQFPNMTDIQKVTLGPRSGLIVLEVPR